MEPSHSSDATMDMATNAPWTQPEMPTGSPGYGPLLIMPGSFLESRLDCESDFDPLFAFQDAVGAPSPAQDDNCMPHATGLEMTLPFRMELDPGHSQSDFPAYHPPYVADKYPDEGYLHASFLSDPTSGTWSQRLASGTPDQVSSVTGSFGSHGFLVGSYHAQEEVYCHCCQDSFLTTESLRHHKERLHKMLNHCQEDGCSWSFKHPKDLRRHVASKHSSAKQFYCNVPSCPYARLGFDRKDNYERHMCNKHGTTPPVKGNRIQSGRIARPHVRSQESGRRRPIPQSRSSFLESALGATGQGFPTGL